MATFPKGYSGVPMNSVRYPGGFSPSRAPYSGHGVAPGVVGNGLAPGGSGWAVYIDLPRLGRALGDVDLRKSPFVSRAINRGIDMLFTQLKRRIHAWTGIPIATVAAGMHKKRASPGHLVGAVTIRGKHYKINSMFGAAWGGPSSAGGTHHAWNNPQLAKHSFMLPGTGTLVTRTTSKRYPIKTLWGPNPAREVIRHRGEVEGLLNGIARDVVVPEIARQVDMEFKRVKAKFGL